MDATKLKAMHSGHCGVITRLSKRISETEDEISKEVVKILQKKEIIWKMNANNLEELTNEAYNLKLRKQMSICYLRIKLQELKKSASVGHDENVYASSPLNFNVNAPQCIPGYDFPQNSLGSKN
jgi:hypothetical protein